MFIPYFIALFLGLINPSNTTDYNTNTTMVSATGENSGEPGEPDGGDDETGGGSTGGGTGTGGSTGGGTGTGTGTGNGTGGSNGTGGGTGQTPPPKP